MAIAKCIDNDLRLLDRQHGRFWIYTTNDDNNNNYYY